jgi:hypothetical protein
MDERGETVNVQRRSLGCTYLLDENLHILARPATPDPSLPQNIDSLVLFAATQWSKQAWRHDVMTMLGPSLSARIFPLHGPAGTCVVVYLELLRVRAERRTPSS